MAGHDKQVREVCTDPWPHAIIDNYFTDDYYEELYSALKDTHPKVLSSELGDSMTYGDERLHQYVKDDIPYLETVFPNRKGPYDELHIDAFLCSQAPWFEYYIHNDAPSKVFGMIVYMGPEGIGTSLYDGPEESNYVKTIEWQPNRALVWPLDMYNTSGERTFHNYRNPTDKVRDTINIMYRMKYDIDEVYPE